MGKDNKTVGKDNNTSALDSGSGLMVLERF